jgi:hypothetical protein
VSSAVHGIGVVLDVWERPVYIGVDYDAVTISGPKDPVIGADVRDDFMKLLMRADTEAKAWAEAEAVARATTPGAGGAVPHVVTDQASHRRHGCPTCLADED